jgi:hypothetical protein
MNAAGLFKKVTDKQSQVRSVSSVEFLVPENNSFERIIHASVKWMRDLNRAIPLVALKGEEFEVGGGGDHPAKSVKFNFDEGSIWSATVDNPDSTVLGRTWVTEITIAKRGEAVTFGSRLLSVTRQSDEPYVPSVPRIVRNVITHNICRNAGVRLDDKPLFINNEVDLEWLVALLNNTSRTIPVVVIAECTVSEPIANISTLAARLCGAAHVIGLSRSQQRRLRDILGREFAVYDGSVRIFWPKFNVELSDPFSQPLWIPYPNRAGMSVNTVLTARVLLASVTNSTIDYPRFQAVRQASADVALRNARNSSTDAELIKLFEDENSALQQQLQELRDEHNQWLIDTEKEKTSDEIRISELKNDLYKERVQNRVLRTTLDKTGSTITKEPLTDLDDFREWSIRNLSSRLWIAPKAIKEMEKNPYYREPTEIGEALYLLDDYYAVVKGTGDSDLHKKLQSLLEEKSLELSSCFATAGDIKNFPEYAVTYQREKLWCDMHIKRAGGKDPRSMFRIYFTWSENAKVLVLGHLPTHLDNNMTN